VTCCIIETPEREGYVNGIIRWGIIRWSDRQTLVGGGGAGCGAWGGVCLWLQFEGSVLVSGHYLWVGHDGGGVGRAGDRDAYQTHVDLHG